MAEEPAQSIGTAAPAAGDQTPAAGPPDNPVVASFTTYAKDYGVSQTASNAVMNWFESPVGTDERSHSYNLDAFAFGSDETKLLNGVLNELSRSGASQADAERVLRWYTDPNNDSITGRDHIAIAREYTELLREAEALDTKDRDNAATAMRERWGLLYDDHRKTIRQYLNSLPFEERESIESERLGDGSLALNDPDRLEALYRQAIGELPSGQSLTAEIKQIEELMRTNRKAYNKDLQMQARYRELLRKRGTP